MKITFKLITAATGLCMGFTMPTNAQQWTTNGTAIYNTNTGNVGIGTGATLPLEKLQVKNGSILLDHYTGGGNLFFGARTTNAQNGMRLSSASDGNGYIDARSTTLTNGLIFRVDNDIASTERMRICANGNIGMGNANPIQKLDINGRVNISNGVIQRGGAAITTTSDLGLYSQVSGNYIRFVTNAAPFKFYADGNLNPIGNTQLFSIEPDGKVVIGSVTTPGNYKLYVQKGILTEKIRVAVPGNAYWADHVFGEDYKLKTLSEVEAFIKENNHLPNIPSAEEVVKEGIDLQTMDAKLLEKIEELTLYMIDIKKENEKMKLEISNLKKGK